MSLVEFQISMGFMGDAGKQASIAVGVNWQ